MKNRPPGLCRAACRVPHLASRLRCPRASGPAPGRGAWRGATWRRHALLAQAPLAGTGRQMQRARVSLPDPQAAKRPHGRACPPALQVAHAQCGTDVAAVWARGGAPMGAPGERCRKHTARREAKHERLPARKRRPKWVLSRGPRFSRCSSGRLAAVVHEADLPPHAINLFPRERLLEHRSAAVVHEADLPPHAINLFPRERLLKHVHSRLVHSHMLECRRALRPLQRPHVTANAAGLCCARGGCARRRCRHWHLARELS
jgi:hypothetical protein